MVCDSELAPSQRRALEDIVKVKGDRSDRPDPRYLRPAREVPPEGKAQVELAQLQPLLPACVAGVVDVPQAGGRVAGGEGIGSRGPGETKIENRPAADQLTDRQVAPRHSRHEDPPRHPRHSRRAHGTPGVAIAGYTSAGESSLLNRLTGAGVLVENQLFATLDTTVRRAQTPDGREFTLTDTVGFVRQLPHELIDAFRSTLEEVADADLLTACRRRRPP